jgi:hypothetical protein
MAYGDNWTKESTPKELKKKANKVLDQLKKDRSGRVFKLIKVCDKPLTYKEIEIKDEK